MQFQAEGLPEANLPWIKLKDGTYDGRHHGHVAFGPTKGKVLANAYRTILAMNDGPVRDLAVAHLQKTKKSLPEVVGEVLGRLI